VYTFEVSTDDPQINALSNFKADCLHQALSFLPKSSVDVRRVEVARAMRLTPNSIEPVTFRVPRLKVLFCIFTYFSCAFSYFHQDWHVSAIWGLTELKPS